MIERPECEEHDQDRAEKVAAQHCSACREEELAWQRKLIAELELQKADLMQALKDCLDSFPEHDQGPLSAWELYQRMSKP